MKSDATHHRSASEYRRAIRLFPGGVNSPVRFYKPYPIFIQKGKGATLTDMDGRKYTDFVLAYGPLILGHSYPEVTRAVCAASASGMIFGAPSDAEVEYAEMIQDAVPSLQMMRFVSTGTEATMHALRLAIHVSGRKDVLKISGGFHGTHDRNFTSDHVREVPFNSLQEAENELKSRRYAAFILEPALGNCGLIPPVDGYLEGVRELTERYGTLLVGDEVITGFRTRFGSLFEKHGVAPDIMTMGKIVGGGMPLALFGGREDIMNKIRPSGTLPQGGTYAAHPVSIAAGAATLRVLKRKDYSFLSSLTEKATTCLSDLPLTVNAIPGALSFFPGTERVIRRHTHDQREMRFFHDLLVHSLEKGLYIPPNPDELFFFSFSHTIRGVERAFNLLASQIEGLSPQMNKNV